MDGMRKRHWARWLPQDGTDWRLLIAIAVLSALMLIRTWIEAL